MPHKVNRTWMAHLDARMTPTQKGVAACLLDAMENKEIAAAMGAPGSTGLHINTVTRAMQKLMERYGARNRVALALALQLDADSPPRG